MKYNIFTLHPALFDSFKSNSLIARALEKNIHEFNIINWRDKYGQGVHKSVDGKPFGGGSGMVLRPDCIHSALEEIDAVSEFYKPKSQEHQPKLPNNPHFESKDNKKRKATIMLSARGYQFNQKTAEWLSKEFDEITLLCGRYEGFDARVNDMVDMEISMGPYIANGGEVPAMLLIESVSRLLPGFVTKDSSILHDSFSTGLNQYKEQEEYIVGKNKLARQKNQDNFNFQIGDLLEDDILIENRLFNETEYKQKILPYIEHPHYTRPAEFDGSTVPLLLQSGDHKKIDSWRKNWFKS